MTAFTRPSQRVGWISDENQEARFKLLTGVGPLEGARVLDVGCGLGCLYGYLEAQGWKGVYTGFDRLKDMVGEARRRYPGARFECRNIAENPPEERWDYAFLCGLFNHKVRDNEGWIRQVVGAALAVSEKGLAFNLLTPDHPYPDADFFYASREEAAILGESIAPGRWSLAPAVLRGDVTLYIRA